MHQTLCPLAKKSIKIPHAPALIVEGKTLSYQELDTLIQATQERLRKRGFSPFDPIPFIAEKELETIVLLFALFREGLIAFPQSSRLSSSWKEKWNPVDPATLFSHRNSKPLPPLIQRNASSLYLFTSGSGGIPKVAILSLDNLILSAEGALSALKLEQGDRWLLSLPLFHVGGLGILFRCFLAGATCVLSTRPLDLALSHHAITHISLVPTQLYHLLEEKKILYPHLKTVLLGGAPFPDSLYKEGLEWELPLMTSWGMTETASLVTCNGQVLPNREVKIDSEGEILVRGPVLFQGYLGAPIQREEWFATKDLGAWENGKLHIKGRKDNLFISGGENIQPEEIERALCSLEEVIEAVVVPKEDPKWGTRPVAFIRQHPGRKLSLEEIHERLKNRIEKFKLPVALHDLAESKHLKQMRKELTP